jgi:hypothetical protein
MDAFGWARVGWFSLDSLMLVSRYRSHKLRALHITINSEHMLWAPYVLALHKDNYGKGFEC